MQTYQMMTAAMMQIMIPVASPPKYTPMSVAIFDVSGSPASCSSGVMVGPDSDIDVVGLGSSTSASGTELGCRCVMQEGLRKIPIVAV